MQLNNLSQGGASAVFGEGGRGHFQFSARFLSTLVNDPPLKLSDPPLKVATRRNIAAALLLPLNVLS